MTDELIGRQSALAEARALFKMIGQDGEIVESLRALIAVSAKDEKVLQAYVRVNPLGMPTGLNPMEFLR